MWLSLRGKAECALPRSTGCHPVEDGSGCSNAVHIDSDAFAAGVREQVWLVAHAAQLTIRHGEHGQVEGSILAEMVTIFGIAVGPVQANKVRLGNTAQVVGNIFHNELTVEPGAHHEGRRPWRPNIERKPIFER